MASSTRSGTGVGPAVSRYSFMVVGGGVRPDEKIELADVASGFVLLHSVPAAKPHFGRPPPPLLPPALARPLLPSSLSSPLRVQPRCHWPSSLTFTLATPAPRSWSAPPCSSNPATAWRSWARTVPA